MEKQGQEGGRKGHPSVNQAKHLSSLQPTTAGDRTSATSLANMLPPPNALLYTGGKIGDEFVWGKKMGM